MPKVSLYLRIFLLVVVFCGQSAYGQTATCDLQIGDAVTRAGMTITIPVMVNNAPTTVDALGFDLSYNPQVLQYTGTFTRGTLVQNWNYFDLSNPEPGRIRAGGFTVVDPLKPGQRGTLVELEFLVICRECGGEDSSKLVLSELVDDIATWTHCPGTLRFIRCVEGEGLKVGDSTGSSGSKGTIVRIPVTIAEQGALNDVDALGFDLSYDPRILQYTGTFTRGDLVEAWDFFDVNGNGPEPGRVRVGGFTVTDPIPAGDSGTVVELEFQVVCSDCAAGDIRNLFLVGLVDDVAGWSACPGTFTFGCPRCGDVDLSGGVTPNDAILAFEQFLGTVGLDVCALEQADVDGDREVTPKDSLEIFQAFFGSPTSSPPTCVSAPAPTEK